jgi:hypothetical protein
VALFTPPNHKIVLSTTCGYLRPIVANTVYTKSRLAHLLSTLNHWFEIIRVFGHLHFRCYTTWSWSFIKFEMSILSRILRPIQKSESALQNKMHILLFLKIKLWPLKTAPPSDCNKKYIFDTNFQRKNYHMYLSFRFTGPFYTVAYFLLAWSDAERNLVYLFSAIASA